MRFRTPFIVVSMIAAVGLMVAGCGTSDTKDKTTGVVVSGQELLGTEKNPKIKQVVAASKAFKDAPTDANACRNLAQTWIAYASPDATKKAGDQPKIPKDRDASLKQARKVLEKCDELKKDPNTTQMLASVYMATSEPKKAAPLLKEIATDRKTDANAYYAWGLAESGALNTSGVITAWTKFLAYADAKDPRIKQTKDSIAALKAEAATKKAAAAKAAAAKKEPAAKK